MFETEKEWVKKEVEALEKVATDLVSQTEKSALATVEQVVQVTVTLIKEHTHAGVAMKIGDEITTYLQQARWLQNMQIAVIKSTQE